MMRSGACQSLSIAFCCCCFLLLLYHLKIPFFGLQFSLVVQPLSHVQLFAIPWTAAHQGSLSITNSRSLLKLMSIESVMPSNHHIFCHLLCHPLLLLHSIFPSIRVFSNESALLIRWPNIRVSASTSVVPMNTQV